MALADEHMSLTLKSSDVRDLGSLAQTLLSPSAFSSPREWQLEFVKGARSLLRADKAALRLPARHAFADASIEVDAEAFRRYREYYHRFDLGAQFGGPAVRGHVWSREQIYGRRIDQFYRSEFYSDLIQPFGLHDAIGVSSLPDLGPDSTVLYLWHEHHAGAGFGQPALDVLQLLLPAFSAASAVVSHWNGLTRDLTHVIDEMGEPSALYTADARVLHRSAAFTALANANASLASALAALCDDAARQLTGLARRRDSDVRWDRLGTISSGTRATPLRVRACYLSRDAQGSEPAILVVATRATPEPNTEELARRFRLTPREVEVARLLAVRRTNSEIASRLGCSVHTARHHVESVMRKLGAASRLSVASLVHERS